MIVPGESFFPIAQYFTRIPFDCHAATVQKMYAEEAVLFRNKIETDSKLQNLFLKLAHTIFVFVGGPSNATHNTTSMYQTKLPPIKKLRRTADDSTDPCHIRTDHLFHIFTRQKIMIAFSFVPSIVVLLTQIDKISKKFFISK